MLVKKMSNQQRKLEEKCDDDEIYRKVRDQSEIPIVLQSGSNYDYHLL